MLQLQYLLLSITAAPPGIESEDNVRVWQATTTKGIRLSESRHVIFDDKPS